MDKERTRQNSSGIRKQLEERRSQGAEEAEDEKGVFAMLNMALR
jgi:hypothetical protein